MPGYRTSDTAIQQRTKVLKFLARFGVEKNWSTGCDPNTTSIKQQWQTEKYNMQSKYRKILAITTPLGLTLLQARDTQANIVIYSRRCWPCTAGFTVSEM